MALTLTKKQLEVCLTTVREHSDEGRNTTCIIEETNLLGCIALRVKSFDGDEIVHVVAANGRVMLL